MDDTFTKVLILVEKEIAELVKKKDAPIDASIQEFERDDNETFIYGQIKTAKVLLEKIKKLENEKNRSDGIHSCWYLEGNDE